MPDFKMRVLLEEDVWMELDHSKIEGSLQDKVCRKLNTNVNENTEALPDRVNPVKEDLKIQLRRRICSLSK